MEHVACEDHAERQRPDEHERSERRILVAATAPQHRHAEREHQRCAQSAEQRGEAESIRNDEPGEGGGPDRVRVEREPAQHDPRPDQACGGGQEQHLPDAALDEGVVKRSEHVGSLR